ncbi:SPOR domain-containing protein [Melaminivora suipulveris]|nr:SPOR domain-containing protein [Melaminivora suipulveris]
MSADPSLAMAPGGLAPQPQAGAAHVGEALYRAALGPVNVQRYLTAFERLDSTGRALPGWNWAAAGCTLGWMVFRRLWTALAFYLLGLAAVAVLLWALLQLAAGVPAPVLAGLALAVVLPAFALPGLYGDVLVHRQMRGRIAAAVNAAPTIREAIDRLERQGATQGRATGVAVGFGALPGLAGLLVWLLLSSGKPAAPVAAEAARAPVAAAPSGRAEPEAAAAVAPASQALEQAPAQPPAVLASQESAPVEAAPAPPAIAQPDSAAQERSVSVITPEPQSPASAASAPPSEARARPAAAVKRLPERAATPQQTAPQARRLYINVGLFADPANARRAHARLQGAGLPSAVREVTAADGRRLQRVRVGPFSSASEANAAAARVKALGLEAAAAASE